MKGTNTLQLNHSEMIRALEYYFNNVQFKEPIKVQSVKEDRAELSFDVVLEEHKEDENS